MVGKEATVKCHHPKSSSQERKPQTETPNEIFPCESPLAGKIRFKKDVQGLGIWKYTKGVQARRQEKRREVRIFSFGHCLVTSISNLVSKGKKS